MLEKINKELKESIMNKETEKATFIRVIKGEFDRVDKKDLTENKIISILKNLNDLALQSDNKLEIEILDLFLPKMLTTEEIESEINNIITENNLSDMKDLGFVMKSMKSKYGSKYDGKVASTIAKDMLGFDSIKK